MYIWLRSLERDRAVSSEHRNGHEKERGRGRERKRTKSGEREMDGRAVRRETAILKKNQ